MDRVCFIELIFYYEDINRFKVSIFCTGDWLAGQDIYMSRDRGGGTDRKRVKQEGKSES